MITKKRKPGHELVLKMQAKATINMTITIFMKIDNLNDQSLSLFTMPLVVVKIDYATSICCHNVGLKALKTSCTTWLHQNTNGDVKPKKPSSTS
jgi:hypothetical protein